MTREKAIRELKDNRVLCINSETEPFAIAYDMAIKALEQEPQIRPKGHWIMTSDYLTAAYGSIDYVKCSCCGEDSLEEGYYCPNCGAEMREVEE